MEKLNEYEEQARALASHWIDTIPVNVRDFIAIAEAFRALEQENTLLKQGCENDPLLHEMLDWKERAEAAETKLAQEKRINSKLREERAGLARECNDFEAKLAELHAAPPAAAIVLPESLIDEVCLTAAGIFGQSDPEKAQDIVNSIRKRLNGMEVSDGE